MANGLAVAERRGAITASDVDQALTNLEVLLGMVIESDSALASVRQALTTARTFRLSAYDAVYLDLARRERLPLATLDEPLRAATARAGVTLLR
jgi:predicted nucleic acid-binding protein